MAECGKVSVCNLHVRSNFLNPDAEVRQRIARLDIPKEALIIKNQFLSVKERHCLPRPPGNHYRILWFKDTPECSPLMENELIDSGYKPLVLDNFMGNEEKFDEQVG